MITFLCLPSRSKKECVFKAIFYFDHESLKNLLLYACFYYYFVLVNKEYAPGFYTSNVQYISSGRGPDLAVHNSHVTILI